MVTKFSLVIHNENYTRVHKQIFKYPASPKIVKLWGLMAAFSEFYDY